MMEHLNAHAEDFARRYSLEEIADVLARFISSTMKGDDAPRGAEESLYALYQRQTRHKKYLALKILLAAFGRACAAEARLERGRS